MPKYVQTLRDFHRGQPVSASHHQEAVDAIRSMDDALAREVGDGFETRSKPRLAKIIAAPTGRTAFTDSRYYARFQYIPETDGGGLVSPSDEPENPLERVVGKNRDTISFREKNYVPVTNVSEPSAWHTLPIDTKVLVWTFFDRAEIYKPHYLIFVEPRRGMIPVSLTQTGGSNGTSSAAATWTYTANDTLGGSAELGTVLGPEWPRPNGRMTAATKGLGYFNTSGVFVLSIAYEKPGAMECA